MDMSTRDLKLAPHPIYDPNPLFDSACHRALRCAEILDQVLQVVCSWNDSDRWRASRSLALACRAFLDPAAAVLWRELPDLRPLYSVLIPEVVMKTFAQRWRFFPDATSVQSEKVPHPRTEAWSRFLRYATLVRKLRQFELNGFESQLFHLLVGRNYGKTFLPFLREFTYDGTRNPEASGLHELSLLSSPAVRIVKLSSRACNEQRLLHLTSTLSNTFPSLHQLILGIRVPKDTSARFFASFAALKQLRHLTLTGLSMVSDPTHLRSLAAALPQLEGLNTGIAWSATPPPQSERASAPSLRRLSIQGPWADVARLPSLLQCPALDDLELWMRPTNGPASLINCDTLCECVREVAEPHFAPRLRRLVVSAPVSHQIGRNRTPVPERRSIADILGPLSVLEHLEDVDYRMSFETRVAPLMPYFCDDDMRGVAVALRHVRKLSLELDLDSESEDPADTLRPSPAPTLLSLVHFATLCPRLISLSLSHVNTTGAAPAVHNKEPPRCKTLRTLHLRNAVSPSTGGTGGLAAFLFGLFPSLDVFACVLSQIWAIETALRKRVRALQEGG